MLEAQNGRELLGDKPRFCVYDRVAIRGFVKS